MKPCPPVPELDLGKLSPTRIAGLVQASQRLDDERYLDWEGIRHRLPPAGLSAYVASKSTAIAEVRARLQRHHRVSTTADRPIESRPAQTRHPLYPRVSCRESPRIDPNGQERPAGTHSARLAGAAICRQDAGLPGYQGPQGAAAR